MTCTTRRTPVATYCARPCLDPLCEWHHCGPNAHGRMRVVEHHRTLIHSDARTVATEAISYVEDDGHVTPALRITMRRLGRAPTIIEFPASSLNALLDAVESFRDDLVDHYGAGITAFALRAHPPRAPELSLAAGEVKP